MIKKLLITFSIIALITSGRAEDIPAPGLDLSKEYTSEDKQQLGQMLLSIQPYLTQEEKNTLSDLIKKGIISYALDLGKKESEKAK